MNHRINSQDWLLLLVWFPLTTFLCCLIFWQSACSMVTRLSVAHRTNSHNVSWNAIPCMFKQGSLHFKGVDSCVHIFTTAFGKERCDILQLPQAVPALSWPLGAKVKNLDVIHIDGSLHKIDKFWRIHLFCDELQMTEADFCVLVTTNAAKIGIDKGFIALQIYLTGLTIYSLTSRSMAVGCSRRGHCPHAFYMLIFHYVFSLYCR